MSLYIRDADNLIVKLKDSDGNLLSFRAQVTDQSASLMHEVTAQDIAWNFSQWKVTLDLENKTLGQVIEAMVENPTGSASTGITAHCEECPDPDTAGKVVTFSSFLGEGRTVLDWLGDFQAATGFRWWIDIDSTGAYHFWWSNPDTNADWSVTVTDAIDIADESASQTAPVEYPTVNVTRQEYANRIRYWGLYEAPALPPGYATWDELLTEATTNWTARSGVTLAVDSTTKKVGTNAIRMTYEYTASGTEAIPRTYSLAYLKVPSDYRDMGSWYYGFLNMFRMMYWDIDGVEQSLFYGQPWVRVRFVSGANTADTGGYYRDYPCSNAMFLGGTSGNYLYQDLLAAESTTFDANDINAICISLRFPVSGRTTQYLSAGEVLTVKLWIDGMTIKGAPTKGGPESGEHFVETAAVTAGTEVPREYEIANQGLPLNTATQLAGRMLDLKSRAQTTISGVKLHGIRNIPQGVSVPVVLTQTGIADSYPLVGVTWNPLDSGDTTELTLGDFPADGARLLRRAAIRIKDLDASRQQ